MQHVDYEMKKRVAAEVKRRYPNHVPVWIRIAVGSRLDTNCLKRNKYLAENEMSFAKFISQLRSDSRLLLIGPGEALFFLVGDQMVPNSLNMGELYSKYKSETDFLEITIDVEHSFG